MMETLGVSGCLKICEAVFEEYKNETLKPWFEARRDFLVQPYTAHQLECLKDIGIHCRPFVNSAKPGGDADQPLVALAMAINHEKSGCWASGPAVVVTFEKRSHAGNPRVKIPDACDFFGIRAIDLYDMIEEVGPI